MAKGPRARQARGRKAGDEPASDQAEPTTEVTPTQRKAIDRLRRTMERDLDRFIAKAVGDKPSEFTDEAGWRNLTVYGRETRASVDEFEGQMFLRVESAVMPLPADRDLVLPLMREALEFNNGVPGYARLATLGRVLLAIVCLPATHISRHDIESCLDDAGILASVAADRLIRRYGGTTQKRARGVGKGKKTGRRRV